MLISVVLNVMNEEENIADLLDSMAIQEQPLEVVVVDAASKDRTREIVKKYAEKYPFIRLYVQPESRGVSTNFGISKARGDIIAFTGGDDIPYPNWIKEIKEHVRGGCGHCGRQVDHDRTGRHGKSSTGSSFTIVGWM